MSLEIYFRECIEMRLNSIAAVASCYPEGPHKVGFFSCLDAVRISFDLPSQLTIPNLRRDDLHLLDWDKSGIIVEP